MRHAEIHLGLPASSFPLIAAQPQTMKEAFLPVSQALKTITESRRNDDEFDDGIDEIDMAIAGMYHGYSKTNTKIFLADAAENKTNRTPETAHQPKERTWKPLQLCNGKWACNHQCKDKTG